MENVVAEKLGEKCHALGDCAGGLTAFWAKKTGLREGAPVSIGNVDAHAAVPAAGVTEPGALVMIMGTSICHMLLGTSKQMVEGMCGTVEDGIVPGLWGYEAGQSAVGDIFAWFFEHGVPDYIHRQARQRKITPLAELERSAAALRPGESGLVALDWWNGNRSVLVDVDLTGLLLGMNLATTAGEIYRALMESTAFGTRTIVEAFESKGVPVRRLVACGGLPERNRLLMQIYADVTGREIHLAKRLQTCSALGAAMHGAVAARRAGGGYDNIFEAAARMAQLQALTYKPDPDRHRVYSQLFQEYRRLHDHFGRGGNDVMKRLKALKRQVASS
jgi:L-ribulokinase